MAGLVPASVSITAAEAICALGDSIEGSLAAWRAGRTGLVPAAHGGLAGPIANRSLLKGRRYGAASNLAVHAARRAVEQAGWTPAELRDAWLFAASSRGNAGELLKANAWRRPSARFSASNTLHSEIAAAVSVELGIRGPWQMLSNGCSSGLDALGLGWMALRCGMARRVLVVAVDLPLVPELLQDFRDTRLLAADAVNDPLSPSTTGFHPGEAAVAATLEPATPSAGPWCLLEQYRANSDAYDSLSVPANGGALAELLRDVPPPRLICPHATGTPNHAQAEVNALRTAFGQRVPPLLLLKALTGHTLGASGLLDVAMLAAAIRRRELPANLAGLSGSAGAALLEEPMALQPGDEIIKIASGMGGHNATVVLRVPG